MLDRICIFAGSQSGTRPGYAAAAAAVGATLARRGIEMVYGGGAIGLMGVAADAALAEGGRVTGVIPVALFRREVAHTGLSELRVVDTMHQRKALMARLSDGFLALPGGLGTLEELFEILTWAQLGVHDKPVGVLNAEGYFDPLRALVRHGVAEGFIRKRHQDLLHIADEIEALLKHFHEYEPPPTSRWLDADST